MKNEVNLAVRQLRQALGDSQKEFADRLGWAISTVGRYELTRAPKGDALTQLGDLARSIGRLDIAQKFLGAPSTASDAETTSEIREAVSEALAANRGRGWLLRELQSLIEDAKTGTKLGFPNPYPSSEEPEHDEQQFRIAYLESLLTYLRLEMDGSALKTTEWLAEKRRAETGETIERARAMIWKSHPELYQQYNQEKLDAALGTQHEAALRVHGTKTKEKVK